MCILHFRTHLCSPSCPGLTEIAPPEAARDSVTCSRTLQQVRFFADKHVSPSIRTCHECGANVKVVTLQVPVMPSAVLHFRPLLSQEDCAKLTGLSLRRWESLRRDSHLTCESATPVAFLSQLYPVGIPWQNFIFFLIWMIWIWKISLRLDLWVPLVGDSVETIKATSLATAPNQQILNKSKCSLLPYRSNVEGPLTPKNVAFRIFQSVCFFLSSMSHDMPNNSVRSPDLTSGWG